MGTTPLLSPSTLPYPSRLPSLCAVQSSPKLAFVGRNRICASSGTVASPCPLVRHGGRRRRNDFKVRSDEGDGDAGGPDGYDMDEEEEVEEIDNKKDYDVEYDRLLGTGVASSGSGASDDIEIVQSKSFVSTRGWDSETVVDYRINEDEFHKISLLHCDFFIRKPPDPDNNVYDFREVGSANFDMFLTLFMFIDPLLSVLKRHSHIQMYVTPPDTDVYAIPKVLSPMPQKVRPIYEVWLSFYYGFFFVSLFVSQHGRLILKSVDE